MLQMEVDMFIIDPPKRISAGARGRLARKVKAMYRNNGGRDVEIDDFDESVTVHVDRHPETGGPGRIFVGWLRDLMRELID